MTPGCLDAVTRFADVGVSANGCFAPEAVGQQLISFLVFPRQSETAPFEGDDPELDAKE